MAEIETSHSILTPPDTPSLPAAAPHAQVLRRHQVAHAVVLAILFAVPALMCLHTSFVSDADIWWHLRTGEWILQHRAVPHTDPFTSFGAGKPWEAYSWLFELLALQLFARLGLVGIVAYSTGMVLAITAAIYHLVRRLQPDATVAALLTLAASLSLTRLFTPRPWLFSILFFTLELDILMHARKTGRTRELLWLPVIFALWANLHIQFIDGLLVLGLAVAEAAAARWWSSVRVRLSVPWLGGALVGCTVAAMVNPYGAKIYKVAYDLAAQHGVLSSLAELQAVPFRIPADFCMLFLALAAAAALGWSRRFLLFETLLLAFAAVVSFRSGRDMWVMAIVAAAIVAQEFRGREEDRRPMTVFTAPVMMVTLGVLLFLGSRAMHVDSSHLRAQLAATMPVGAVQVVKERGYTGPLYNNFDWGGYLIWALRMPVSVDGRAAFNGDERLDRFFATWNAGPGWASDPDLKAARLVIAPVGAPLTQLLRMDPRFQVAYEDNVAAVFVAAGLRLKY